MRSKRRKKIYIYFFWRNIIGSLDPEFSKDLLFVAPLIYINNKLELKATIFTIGEKKITLFEDKMSEICQKTEDKQSEPFYFKKNLTFFLFI